MNEEHGGPTSDEQDAICAQCGTANPDGSETCPACGNDLRAQRVQRMAHDDPAVLAQQARKQKQTRIALAAGGVALLLAVALNAGRIADWIIDRGDEEAVALWRGAAAASFEDLAAEVEAWELTPQQIDTALFAGGPGGDLSGRYVLMRPGHGRGAVLGRAIVEEIDDRLYFVAVLTGGPEIRGIASVYPEYQRVVADIAGIRENGVHQQVYGWATPGDHGGFVCYGQMDFEREGFLAVDAFRVPAS